MRNGLLLALAALLVSYPALSQARFGIKAGMNLANQEKTVVVPPLLATTQNSQPLLAYQVGGFYKVKLGKHAALSAEPALSVVGSRSTLVATDMTSYRTRERIGYLELPLFFQYSVGKWYAGAGPGIGFRLFSKLAGFENRTFDVDYYRTLETNGNLLLGFAVGKQLDINLRYSHGFSNALKNPGSSSIRNRSLQLSVLYYLE